MQDSAKNVLSCLFIGKFIDVEDNFFSAAVFGKVSNVVLEFSLYISKENQNRQKIGKAESSVFPKIKERETGLEPATPTLARLCSTN